MERRNVQILVFVASSDNIRAFCLCPFLSISLPPPSLSPQSWICKSRRRRRSLFFVFLSLRDFIRLLALSLLMLLSRKEIANPYILLYLLHISPSLNNAHTNCIALLFYRLDQSKRVIHWSSYLSVLSLPLSRFLFIRDFEISNCPTF